MRAKAAMLLTLCAAMPYTAPAQAPVDGRSIADETSGANWLSYGRTYSEPVSYTHLTLPTTERV